MSDAVLGVSMTPTSVRTVLVAGAKADGVAVNHGNFDIAHGADLPTGTTTEQIIATILITRETAASAGYEVKSAGVTWLDVAAATALREGLATRRVDNVLLVSPFHSAIALARAAGESAGYNSTALLCIEPDVATLAVVGIADGMVVEVRRRFLPSDDDEAVGALADIVKDAGEMEGGPQGVFVVGSGVDVPLIMPALCEATPLPVTAPEQPETALARGAALASANTELLTASAIELARSEGRAAGYTQIALLCIEPDSATSAILNTCDEGIAEVRRRFLPSDDAAALDALVEIVNGMDGTEDGPQGIFLLGSGVNVPLIMPDLVAATALPISTPEQPSVGPARGAALASASASSLASSAVALARAAGESAGYDSTALLSIEPDVATLAVVGTADGMVVDLRRRFLPHDDDEAVAALVEIVKGAGDMEGGPQGVFVVGSGVDIPMIMPALAEVTTLPVTAPEQPAAAPATDVTPARASLFASSTAFLNGEAQNATAPGHSTQAADNRPVVLEARGLYKSFGSGPTAIPIIHDINLQIRSGEFVAMVGPSGSGKSTLLSILGLLEPPTSGEVLVNGMSVAQLSARELARVRGRRIGYVFQSFNLLSGLSVAENVMLPSLLAGQSGRVQHDRAIALLEQFGLGGMAKRVPAELSGGEQQRVAIARALFMAPQVVLADEPTGNLDTKNGRRVIEALYNLNAAGQTIVLVTHDRSIADEAPRLVSLLDGGIESDKRQVRRGGAAWRAPH
ncbi:ABC transporter ATP-binding protein [Mycobacterium sp. 1245111.1]|uniref:ABC transporter ATP-binding protein n=1 Tax=Mycobacterium sp. 1245111.1 TaxID=1834073 RepID=UPI001E39BE2B|nr:ABC transporter ATP-binding protein [Mycobacterium sp. 1245111.1]